MLAVIASAPLKGLLLFIMQTLPKSPLCAFAARGFSRGIFVTFRIIVSVLFLVYLFVY
jgi:hypothetical protein